LILGLSDAIIGLTIFAMVCILSLFYICTCTSLIILFMILKGNSLGDFVANITIAKMGFPTMAVSACFGGPMLSKFNHFLIYFYIVHPKLT
jgi:sodium/potassium/calcium exchanger 6